MRYGLIGIGPVSKYFAAKLPNLRQELGAVAASTPRAASRIVNTLRAGEPRRLKDLEDTPTILICAPGNHFPSLLPLLEKAALNWKRKSLVLANSCTFSRDLEVLRAQGASVASLQAIAGAPNRYLLEGDPSALRTARYLVKQLRGAAVEIKPEQFALYSAARTFSDSLFTPLLDSCLFALNRSGVSGGHPTQLLETLFMNTLRTYLYSGRKSWSGTVADGNQEFIERELDALERTQPAIADFYRASMGATVNLFHRRRLTKPRHSGRK